MFSHLMPTRPGVFKLDLRTKRVSPLPGAETLMYPKCSRQGDLLASQSPATKNAIQWHGRADWEQVDLSRLGYANWTRDGEAIIGLSFNAHRIERFDLKTRQWTTVADLAGTPLVSLMSVPWMGLAADDSPLVMRDDGTRDLYAFDWDAP